MPSAAELRSHSSLPREGTKRGQLTRSSEIRPNPSERCKCASERGKMNDAMAAARKKVRTCACTCPCSPHAH
eukprot:1440695-Rhodomonas_salina.1